MRTMQVRNVKPSTCTRFGSVRSVLSPASAVCVGAALVCLASGRAGVLDQNTGPTLSVTELWATRGSPTLGEFVAIGGMAEAADGSVWVSDPRLGQVMVLDSQGTPKRIAARRGEGPGEVRSPTRIARAYGNQLAVYDIGRASVEIFEPDGRFARRVRLPFRVVFAKGFAALPTGGFVVSGGVYGKQTSIHRFGPGGRLEESWYPIPGTRNPRAAVTLAGGPLAAEADGSLLFAQAAPLRIMVFPPSFPESGGEPIILVPESDLVPAIGDEVIVETVERGELVRTFRLGYPQARAIFRRRDQTILCVVTLAEEDRSIWLLYGPSGRARAQREMGRAYLPWSVTDSGDVLASYISTETGEHFAVRLAIR